MTATSFGAQFGRRKRQVTAAVMGGLGLTVVVVALAYWRSSARQTKPLPLPQALPTNVHQQLSGYSFTRSEEVHEGDSSA